MSATMKALMRLRVPSAYHLAARWLGAVEVVGVVGDQGLGDGLFAVVEDEPDGVALGRVGAEVLRRVR
jgi:hypothetical protein